MNKSVSNPPLLPAPADYPGIGLREYLEARIAVVDERAVAALRAHIEIAQLEYGILRELLTKSESTYEARLNGLGEIREALVRQRGEFATIVALDSFEREYRTAHEALRNELMTQIAALRTYHDADLEKVNQQIETLKENSASLLGRITGMGIIVVIASLALQVIFFLIAHQ